MTPVEMLQRGIYFPTWRTWKRLRGERHNGVRPGKKKWKKFHEQFGRCIYCGKPMIMGNGRQLNGHDDFATREHFIAQSKLKCEADNNHNVVLACGRCNKDKKDMPIIVWLAKLRTLDDEPKE